MTKKAVAKAVEAISDVDDVNAWTFADHAAVNKSAGTFRGNVATVIENLRNGKMGGAMIADVASRIGVTPERLIEELRLPNSTAAALAENADLLPVERDRIYRVDKVLERAIDVLEDSADARVWITGRIRSLGGVSPLSLLDTEAGYELVLNTLKKIEYGIFS